LKVSSLLFALDALLYDAIFLHAKIHDQIVFQEITALLKNFLDFPSNFPVSTFSFVFAKKNHSWIEGNDNHFASVIVFIVLKIFNTIRPREFPISEFPIFSKSSSSVKDNRF
jgi:hypothetical protein